MIYLDYAKATPNGYILNFFADSEDDLADISNGKRFVTKNGTDYGVPLPSSTVVITMPDKTKKTYVLNGDGEWLEGGVEMDYSKLENAPITLANLAEEGFEPESNTYYEHMGETTEDFIKGIIYLYDGKEYKAIDGSGSGGGVQADYNQNDSAAADYIKNRPFYESPAVLFDENITTSELEEGSELYVWETTNKTVNVNIGAETEVIFDGVEYTQIVKPYSETVGICVGNLHIASSSEEDTKEPFLIILDLAILTSDAQGKIINGITVITQTAYNGEVKIIANDVKTIDPKFIKDMYYTEVKDITVPVYNGSLTSTKNSEVEMAIFTPENVFELGEIVMLKIPSKGIDVATPALKYDEIGISYIGNANFMGIGDDTGEDYLVATIKNDEQNSGIFVMQTAFSNMEVEINVKRTNEVVYKLDKKYLPNGTATESYVDTAISNAITKTLNTEV